MRALFRLLCLIALLPLLAGCERAAKVDEPKIFDQNGVHFSYPGNWKIAADELMGNERMIQVESSADGLFLILALPGAHAAELEGFVREFSAEASRQMPIGKITNTDRSSVSSSALKLAGEGIRETATVSLLGQKTRLIRDYYVIERESETWFLISQTPEDVRSKVEPGFELIQRTLAFN